jgi:hypothetical protein
MGFYSRKKEKKQERLERISLKNFFDRTLPGVLKFYNDHYICGDSYRCVWVIKEYPPSTEEQAILSRLADRSNVTVRIYNRLVDAVEQHKIFQNAHRRNLLKAGGNDVQETVEAESNLKDMIQLLESPDMKGSPLLHTAVFLELKATDPERLRELQSDVEMELTRAKINVDKLTLRQLDGFLSITPFGNNRFGSLYERVLPASSVAKVKGKKVYGYLRPDLKVLVNQIVDELAKDKRIAALYDLWYQDKQAARNVYGERPIERVPLSQNPDFKPVRNAVVRAAAELDQKHSQAQHPAYTPPLLPMATRLLRQVGQIFGRQFQIDPPVVRLTDSKLRQKIAEKKLALGQKLEM